MCKSKNRHFYHIFVSPGDTPGAITLNIAWIEREFDVYKLPRCMCPSNYNRFWVIARYWSNIVNFSYLFAFRAPLEGFPSEYRYPVWCGKTRMVWLPDGEKISEICLFVLTWSTNVTDGRTDGRTDRRTPHDIIDLACIASRHVIIACHHMTCAVIPAVQPTFVMRQYADFSWLFILKRFLYCRRYKAPRVISQTAERLIIIFMKMIGVLVFFQLSVYVYVSRCLCGLVAKETM